MGWLQTGVLLLVAAAGAGVVRTRDPLQQSIAVSFYGLTLALLFFLHQAPDVALSQIVVGGGAAPHDPACARQSAPARQGYRTRGNRSSPR